MKLNINKEWFEARVSKEADLEIGAGNPNFMTCPICKGYGFIDIEKYDRVEQEDCKFCNTTGEYESLKTGDKVIFTGVKPFWFTDITTNGYKLEVGRKYTIKSRKTNSSWSNITLEETGDLEYNLAWFE